MSARGATGWQTSLADLSLILFMVAAAAASRVPLNAGASKPASAPAIKRQTSAAPSPQAEPLAVYIAEPGAPPIREWLARQDDDPRHRLTVTARYGEGGKAQGTALAEALELAREAGRAGRQARIVVEPGSGPARVVLAFDAPGAEY